MARAATSFTCFFLISSLLFPALFFSISEADNSAAPIVNGLSWSFYKSSCPKVESIIRSQLKKVFKKDIGQAAGLLRLHFHDCFVQSGGPDYDVPLGRRDGLTFATRNVTLQNLPPPTANASVILASLATKNLDATDVVALSGGHSIGISHCTSFTNRLYPTQDPVMDKTFANNLKGVCPTANSTNTTVLDIRSPDKFDNKYYVNLMNRQGLFTSDQDLYTDSRTKSIVTSFAINETLFFEKFALSMIKMGQLSVLTGKNGEIRANCSVRNPDNKSYLAMKVDDEVEEDRAELR
ncbi:Plant peroxidase [Corchorus capsularis]|uniref:Peroxidase n=1 Tax=Corchorus capsularis TaxID=210143 RepID=A0A1R3IFL3_COCAP|nr:Plant peroxidase [Corchorus capsularis]